MALLISWCQRVRCTFPSDLSRNRSFQLLKLLSKDTRLSAFKQSSWWFIHLSLNMIHALHLDIYFSSVVSLQFTARWFCGCFGFFSFFFPPGTCACRLTLCHIMTEYWYFISSTLIFPSSLLQLERMTVELMAHGFWMELRTEPNIMNFHITCAFATEALMHRPVIYSGRPFS